MRRIIIFECEYRKDFDAEVHDIRFIAAGDALFLLRQEYNSCQEGSRSDTSRLAQNTPVLLLVIIPTKREMRDPW